MANTRDDLLGAVKRGDLDTVHDLVEAGGDVNAFYGLQGTLLCAAIQAKQSEVAIYLIDSDCDVNTPDVDGEPPICLAIRKGQVDVIKNILHSSRCNVHSVDPVSQNPPLSVAVTHGTPIMVKMLLDAGCDVNKQGKDFNTAWHLAVKYKKPDVIDVLKQATAGDVNMWNINGKTAFHLSVEQTDSVMLASLLKVLKRDREEPRESLRKHLDLDRRIIYNGNTALHLAIENGNFRSTEMLIHAGCDVNLPNEAMHTPLLFACKTNCAASVSLLLKNGADPNVVGLQQKQFHVRNNTSTQTPLNVAIRRGALAIVRQLVENGANLNQKAAGNLPLIQALMEDKAEIVSYFLDEGIKRGLNISLVNGSCGQNALGVIECCSNVRGFAQRLIDLGCLVSGCHDRRLPLEYAVDFDCTEAVEVLLDNGADANTPLSGMSALQHCAVDGMSEDLLHLLLFYGADISIRNLEGHSLIKLAIDNFNFQIVKYLIAVGYNLSTEPMSQALSGSEDGHDDDDGCGSGSDCRDSQAELYEWLARKAAYPCSLQTQCRTTLRSYFLLNEIQMKKMAELPLPPKLKDFVMLKTLFEETLRL